MQLVLVSVSYTHLKVTNSQIREELSHRVTDSNLICVKQKKEFKKAVKGTKSKKVVVNKTQIRRGVYSVQVVDKHVNDFKVWLRRFLSLIHI